MTLSLAPFHFLANITSDLSTPTVPDIRSIIHFVSYLVQSHSVAIMYSLDCRCHPTLVEGSVKKRNLKVRLSLSFLPHGMWTSKYFKGFDISKHLKLCKNGTWVTWSFLLWTGDCRGVSSFALLLSSVSHIWPRARRLWSVIDSGTFQVWVEDPVLMAMMDPLAHFHCPGRFRLAPQVVCHT